MSIILKGSYSVEILIIEALLYKIHIVAFTVTVHYEMYDGVPILSKWISVTGNTATMVSVHSVEYLALNQPWSIGGLETDTITGATDSG